MDDHHVNLFSFQYNRLNTIILRCRRRCNIGILLPNDDHCRRGNNRVRLERIHKISKLGSDWDATWTQISLERNRSIIGNVDFLATCPLLDTHSLVYFDVLQNAFRFPFSLSSHGLRKPLTADVSRSPNSLHSGLSNELH